MATAEREGIVDPQSRFESPSLADRYRALVEHSPDAIGVHRGGIIVYVNPAGLRYLRAEKVADVVGHPITKFIAADSIGPMLERIADLDSHGAASAPSEATVLALDGSSLTMEAVSVRTVWNGEPAFQVILRDLTEHKAAQKALQNQAALVQHVSDAIIGVTSDGVVSSWNPAAESVYGRAAADVLGQEVSDAVGAPCDPESILAHGGRRGDSHRHANGAALAISISAAQMPDGYVLVCADHSAVRRAEDHFTSVVESLEAGVVVLDHAGHIESANLAAKTILDIEVGMATDEQEQVLPFRVYGTDGEPIAPLEHPVAITSRTGKPYQAVIGIERFRDGRTFWLSLTATMLSAGDPCPSIVATFVDVTETHRTSMELEHAATHDDLTGLPNRPLILARLDEELAVSDREDAMAVLFIDLDNFKTINDLHGHTVGDAVLGVVAARLTRALPVDAFVGRIGGDEFVAVVPRCGGSEADDVRVELSTPITIGGRSLTVTASIGRVTVDRDETRCALDILDDADHKMYEAKPVAQQASALYQLR